MRYGDCTLQPSAAISCISVFNASRTTVRLSSIDMAPMPLIESCAACREAFNLCNVFCLRTEHNIVLSFAHSCMLRYTCCVMPCLWLEALICSCFFNVKDCNCEGLVFVPQEFRLKIKNSGLKIGNHGQQVFCL